MSRSRWQDVPRRALEYFVKHWFLSVIIQTLPGWFALVLRYWGLPLGLTASSDQLTVLGTVALVLVFLTCTLFALAKSKGVQYEQRARANGEFVVRRLLTCVNLITTSKLDRLCALIRGRERISGSPLDAITAPEEQIPSILQHIQATISEVHGIERDQVGVSVACSRTAADHDAWTWLGRINGEGDLELHELLRNPASSFYQVMFKRAAGTLFYPDKRVALERNAYVESEKDGRYQTVGSILVHRISIEVNGHVLLAAVLGISTYGKQLCEQDDEEAVRKVLEFLLPCFDQQLRLELAAYYFKNVYIPQVSFLPPAPSLPPAPALPH